MGIFKDLGRKPGKNQIHLRSKYIDQSRRFLEWVHRLGLERTFMGRLIADLDQRFSLRRLGLLLMFSVVLASFVFTDFDFTYKVRLGSVASTDIKSPVSMDLVDEEATEVKRQEAERDIPPVFDYDPNAYERLYDSVYRSFLTMRRQVRTTDWPVSPSRLEDAVKDFMVHEAEFEKDLGREVPARLVEWLIEKRFSARVENVIIRALAKWSAWRLADGVKKTLPEDVGKIIVRVVKGGTHGEEFVVRREDIHEIGDLGQFNLADVRGTEFLNDRDLILARDFAQVLLTPNLTYNMKETEDRRRKARTSVLPIMRSIQKNQLIVPEGQPIQAIHIAIINHIRELKSDRRTDLVSLAAALLFLTLIVVFFSYLRRFTVNRITVTLKDVIAMAAVSLLVTALSKIFLLFTDHSLVARLGSGSIPGSAALFLAPVATGPMLLGLLITSGEVVWLFSVFLATVLALMVDMNFSFLLVSIVGGIAAGRGVFGCKQRNDIYWAGLRAGIVNAIMIFLLSIIQKLGEPNLGLYLLWTVPAGLFSGLLSSMVAMSVVPLFETWFNYTTDIKLLELASLNHPLMKEMIVKAPGTYHHSLVVGSMCEAAAEEIGANALLAKVMAYYHDIGKTEHAQYFIENQRQGHNPHDHISPNMSRTILVAHVKDGVEMGFHYRLGKPIIDGILQHHGTTLISFFYNKALEGQDADIDQVAEEDFRYPGPKPQFREAALVMLADSIEAAARSLDEPTPGRLQNIVKNIIQNKFLDGQLDECNLTLKDLTVIENAFRRVLLGIYHQRIDYPMKYSATQSAPRSRDRKGHFSA